VTGREESFRGGAGWLDFAGGRGDVHRREKVRLHEERRKRIRVEA
jgi:hypothetical protein